MLERDIEAHLVKVCKKYNILCEKFTSSQRRSVPDRILTWRGRVVFLELKATGKEPTEAQVRDHDRRAAVGAEVGWTDSVEGVEQVALAMLGLYPLPHAFGSRKVLVPDDEKTWP